MKFIRILFYRVKGEDAERSQRENTRHTLRRFMGHIRATVQQYHSGENGLHANDYSIRMEHQYRSS